MNITSLESQKTVFQSRSYSTSRGVNTVWLDT